MMVPDTTITLVTSLMEMEWVDTTTSTFSLLSSLLRRKVVEEVGQVVVVVATILLVPSTIGYLGAVRENPLLLTLYLSPLLLSWLLQLLLLILLPMVKEKVYMVATSLATSSLSTYRMEPSRQGLTSVAWDHIMSSLSCCGVSNYTDFTSLPTGYMVTSSCCILDMTTYPATITPTHPQCLAVPTTYNSYFLTGCLTTLTTLASSHISSLILITILLLSLQLLLIILATCLCLLQRGRSKVERRMVVVREPYREPYRQPPGGYRGEGASYSQL